jgi:hypothetical protein
MRGGWCSTRLTHLHVLVATFSLWQLVFLLFIFAATGLGLQIFAAGVGGCVLLLSRCYNIGVAHFGIFAVSLWNFRSFGDSFFLFLLFSSVCSFIVGSNVCLGLVWWEFGRCGGFRVPRLMLVNCHEIYRVV